MKTLWRSQNAVLVASTEMDGDFAVPRPDRPGYTEGLCVKYEQRVRALFAQQGVPIGRRLVVVRSVHGAAVADADLSLESASFANGVDGLMTGRPGTTLLVTGADCPPIMLVDSIRNAAVLLHSGRKGTEANIVRTGMSAMRLRYGTHPGNVTAVIGPGICGAHYEVSRTDAEPFRRYEGLADAVVFRGEVANLNLRVCIRKQLADEGVTHVIGNFPCTFSAPSAFSFRRDVRDARAAGREPPKFARVQFFAVTLSAA